MAELLSTTSIVPIAGALAKKLGLSLPGNDAVKEAEAIVVVGVGALVDSVDEAVEEIGAPYL